MVGEALGNVNRAGRAGLIALASLAVAGCADGDVSAPDPSAFDAGYENRRALAFSPDGEAAFWVEWDGKWGSHAAGPTRIYTSDLADGSWSGPRPMPFTGAHSDDDPFVSPDGRWLYFVSERPANDSDEDYDGDIWRYSLTGDEILERLSINSPANEYSPIVVTSGALYFASSRDGGYGQGDLYRSEAVSGTFSPPVNLGSAVNTPTGEWNLWVSPDETELVFEASGRLTNITASGDLYLSRRGPDGWGPAIALDALNTPGSDLLPRMHPDGETLFYTTAPLGGHARITGVEWAALR